MTQTLIHDAIEHTRKLTNVMVGENELLANHKRGEEFEEIIKEKRALAAKVEKLLSDVKAQKQSIREDISARNKLPELEVVIQDYQTTARKNVLLLRAAHQATADVLNIFRRAVDKVKPKAETYNKDGQLSSGASAGSLVTKSV